MPGAVVEEGWPAIERYPLDVDALLSNLPVPFIIFDLANAGNILFINRACADDFGFSGKDTPTLAAWLDFAFADALCREETIGRWDAQLARSTSGRYVPPEEYRIRDARGVSRRVLIGLTLEGTCMTATLQDIMPLLGATRSGDQASTAYALTENMPAGAYTMIQAPGAALAEFAFLSKQFLSMLDLTREEAVGDPAHAFARIHPEDHARWLELNVTAFATGVRFSGETRVVVHGETRWVRAESVPRVLEDGSTLWEGVVVDITRLKEAEDGLQRMITASRALLWRLDLKTQRLEFNQEWARVHGYAPDTHVTTLDDWFEAVHPEDTSTVRRALERLVTGGEPRGSVTHRRKTSDGRWLWLRVHAGTSDRNSDGTPSAVSGVSFDITEEMEAKQRAREEQALLREELQKAQQREVIAQVSERVAHDLSNLIVAISGTSELLETHRGDDDRFIAGMTRIRRSVSAARDLVADLERLIRPAQAPSLQAVDVVLGQAVNLVGAHRVTRHHIRTTIPDPIPSVYAHITELVQVIVNLTINACESGDAQDAPRVTLTVQPEGALPPQRPPDVGTHPPDGARVTLLTISDSGVGLSPAVREQVFRRQVTTKGDAATGLGLLIVATILQNNRAALWMESNAGSGTTVTVAWPAEAPTVSGLPPAPRRADPGTHRHLPTRRLDGLSLLVVDDKEDIGAVLAEMLEAAGAMCLVETDPREAQRALREAPELWSAVITDLDMPHLDGRDLARFVAGLPDPVPVLLASARTSSLSVQDRELFAAVLAKPVSAEDVVRAVLAATSPGASTG